MAVDENAFLPEVAFESDATRLVPRDVNGMTDVFFTSGTGGHTELMSEATDGTPADGASRDPAIDSRNVAFESDATNLAGPDHNGLPDVYVRSFGDSEEFFFTARVSVDAAGGDPDGASRDPAFGRRAQYVAFTSDAGDLLSGGEPTSDTNGVADVFVRDRDTDGNGLYDQPGGAATTRVSAAAGGGQADGPSGHPSMSYYFDPAPGGNLVAFDSQATNLVPGAPDANGVADVYLRDTGVGTTSRISVAAGGGEPNGPSTDPSVRFGGRFVAFASAASNLVPNDTNGVTDVFVRDRQGGTTTRVSVGAGGMQANGPSRAPSLSPDGLTVAFESTATNLVVGDTNGGRRRVRGRPGGGHHAARQLRAGRRAGERVERGAGGRRVRRGHLRGLRVAGLEPGGGPVPGLERVLASRLGHGRERARHARREHRSVGGGARRQPRRPLRGVLERQPVGRPARLAAAVGVRPRHPDGRHRAGLVGRGRGHRRPRDRRRGDQRRRQPRGVRQQRPAHTRRPRAARRRLPAGPGGRDDRAGEHRPGRRRPRGLAVPAAVAERRWRQGRVQLQLAGHDRRPGRGHMVFVRDRAAGTTSIVTQQDTGPTQSTISADGRRVVFETRDASDPGDTNSAEDVLVRDLVTSTTARVSITTAGAAGNNDSFDPDISDDGRFVAFASVASNFVAGDDFGSSDVFVHDRDNDGEGVFDEPGARTTTLADITAAGGRAGQSLEPALSGDGRLVAFTSDAGGVVPGDTNFARDAFVRDRASGTTTLVSADAVGTVGSDRSTSPLLSGDGHHVVFRSDASNLVSGDRNRTGDVFITSAVRPAVAGVAPGLVARGATVTVTITGTGFLDDATVAVSGTGVTVRRVMATATAITARVTVATTAAPGERSVTVTNPGTGPGDSGADARCGGCLTIT